EEITYITVPIVNDNELEPDELFLMNLSSPTNAVLFDEDALGVIRDDESRGTPTLSVDNQSVAEDIPSGEAVFTVTRSGDPSGVVTVDYTTVEGTAIEGAGPGLGDYDDTTGTLTFGDGDQFAYITVDIIDDLLLEPDESYFVILSNANGNGAIITDAVGDGEIRDNEVPPAGADLAISNESLPEDGGTMTFTVTRSSDLSGQITVDVTTNDIGSATENVDYVGSTTTLTFADGQSTATFDVTITDDNILELDETFIAVLSNASPGANILVDTGIGIIEDEELSNTQIGIRDSSVDEDDPSGAMVFEVVRVGDTTGTSTVQYSTQALDATQGALPGQGDYLGVSGTLTFAAGEEITYITVPIVNDSELEPDELFLMNLSSPTNAVLFDEDALGVIRDDES
ncbi:MAG: hypothetical protein GY708_01605, partial [Actinomycetia bacterium]|nr:hypothetical protein [Actinomycetes bacterium]